MIRTIIFDLDDVIVSTDDHHYQAWKMLAQSKSIPFDREENNLLRGVSRCDSPEIILRKATKRYTEEEEEAMRKKKNDCYVSLLKNLSPKDILSGFSEFHSYLRKQGIKTAIGSSSKNTKTILSYLGPLDSFDAIADGTEVSHSKPDPEVFLHAAKKTGTKPEDCAVIEDAVSGIEDAKAGIMNAVAIKDAKQSPIADILADSFMEIAEQLHLLKEKC